MNLSQAYKNYKNSLPHYQKLYDYYLGKNKIINRQLPDPQKPNNKVSTLYGKSIVETVVGFFASVPVTIMSEDEDYLKQIKQINFLNEADDVNAEQVKLFTLFGKSYELYWLDNGGKIRFKQYSPLDFHVETNVDGDILFAIQPYEVTEEGKKVIKMRVFTENMIYNFKSYDKGNTFFPDDAVEDIEHYFKDVPVTIFKNNEEETSDIEPFITMIDGIDVLLSDSLNSVEAFVNAYLVLAGVEGTDYEDLKRMKQDGVLLLSNSNDAKWLTKSSDAEFQKLLYETLENMIHEQSGTPKLTSEKFSSNMSSQAIKFHLFSLIQKSNVKERKMSKALRRRIRMITTMLNNHGGEYDHSNITFQFSRNIPSDESAITDQIVKLHNIVPVDTLLSWHPRIENVELEMNKLLSESDTDNLDGDFTKMINDYIAAQEGAEQ